MSPQHSCHCVGGACAAAANAALTTGARKRSNSVRSVAAKFSAPSPNVHSAARRPSVRSTTATPAHVIARRTGSGDACSAAAGSARRPAPAVGAFGSRAALRRRRSSSSRRSVVLAPRATASSASDQTRRAWCPRWTRSSAQSSAATASGRRPPLLTTDATHRGGCFAAPSSNAAARGTPSKSRASRNTATDSSEPVAAASAAWRTASASSGTRPSASACRNTRPTEDALVRARRD